MEFKKLLVVLKIFVQRSLSYLTIFNAGSLFFLVADALKKYGFNYSIKYLAPLLFFASIVLCILLGYIDYKTGLYEKELEWGSTNNPVFMKILREVEGLKRELECLKK